MLGPAEIRDLFRYNRAVLETYERALRRLPWRVFARNRESGHLSLKNTYLHILQVHDGWLNYIVSGRLEEMVQRPDPYRLNSWKEIQAWSDSVWKGIEAGLRRLTPRACRSAVRAPWMPGTYTVADAYLQTTFEQAHHLGEIIALLWQMDREPPAMTWIEVRRKLERRQKRTA